MMKRKLEDHLGDELDDLLFTSRPTKKITMCYNTPKQAKDEKKKLMKTSKRKLKQMDHPETNLRRSVLVNNVYKKLQAELRQEKSTKYYGYAFNPKCPLGFGTMKEYSERKRLARLEQLLKEKNEAKECNENSTSDQNDLDSSMDTVCEQLDELCSDTQSSQGGINTPLLQTKINMLQGDNQTSQLCEDVVCVNECLVTGSVNDPQYLTNKGSNKECDIRKLLDNASANPPLQHTQHSDNIYEGLLSCDTKQTVESNKDNLCQFTPLNPSTSVNDSDMIIAKTPLSSQTNNNSTAVLDSMECDTALSPSCDLVFKPNNCFTNEEASCTLDYDSENEEIDVCSCEDDDNSVLSSSSLLIQQQIQEQQEKIQELVTFNRLHNNNNSDMEYNAYHIEDNKENNASIEMCQINSSQVQSNSKSLHEQSWNNSTSCNFPQTKSDSNLTDDICRSCDSNRNDQQGFINSAYPPPSPFSNSNNNRLTTSSSSSFNSGGTGTYQLKATSAQGQLHRSIFERGLVGHAVSPFCHPLLSSPFYQGFVFPPTSSTTSTSNTSAMSSSVLSSYYSNQGYGAPVLFNAECHHYLQGLATTGHFNKHHSTSNIGLSANMVTCT